MSQEQALAADIETQIRAVPGVTAIFHAGDPVAHLLDAGARLLGIRDDDAPRVGIERTPDGVLVTVAVGVHAAVGAVETVRQVHAAVDALLAASGDAPVVVQVTIVHVEDDG